MNITVLGAGLMGAPVACRLAECGHTVCVWNRTPDHVAYLEETGLVGLQADAATAISGADVVVLMVSDAEAIASVLDLPGVLEALSGKILVQMGTISPEQSRVLAAELAVSGVAYLEAPVLGSRPEAALGTLQIMAGGEPEVYSRCLPFLEDCGKAPVLVGPVGQAAALKLAMNQLIAALTAGFSLSLGLVRREGLPVDIFLEILRGSSLYAATFDKKLERMLNGVYSEPNFPLRHLLKDVKLCAEVATGDGLSTDALEAIGKLLASGVEQGYGDDDYSALAGIIDPRDAKN